MVRTKHPGKPTEKYCKIIHLIIFEMLTNSWPSPYTISGYFPCVSTLWKVCCEGFASTRPPPIVSGPALASKIQGRQGRSDQLSLGNVCWRSPEPIQFPCMDAWFWETPLPIPRILIEHAQHLSPFILAASLTHPWLKPESLMEPQRRINVRSDGRGSRHPAMWRGNFRLQRVVQMKLAFSIAGIKSSNA